MSRLSEIKNFYFPAGTESQSQSRQLSAKDKTRNLSNYISNVQFSRMRVDVKMWRDAIIETEAAYYPHRVKMQRIFQDTIINEHVAACWERRKDLTLLRDFKVCDDKGNGSDELKKLFRNIVTNTTGETENASAWFDDFISYGLDAIGFGYSLISLGDIINDRFIDLSIIRRQNISPDRLTVNSIVYGLSGQKFMEDPYVDWHVWVPTSSELGVSKCGYGLFYKIARAEILLRNNTGYNADFIEIFGQPLRKGKTSKTDETERAVFENALKNMGSTPYILLDEGMDDVEFVVPKGQGTSWQSYENFERRLQKLISKLLLGHSDALDSTPGKLGSGQDGEESPVAQALSDKQVKDGIFIQNIVNSKLIPRMRKHGFKIPLNYHFEYLNDNEKEEARQRVDKSNQATTDIAVAMRDAGMVMDPKYFTDRTGIPTTPVQVEPIPKEVNPKEPIQKEPIPNE